MVFKTSIAWMILLHLLTASEAGETKSWNVDDSGLATNGAIFVSSKDFSHTGAISRQTPADTTAKNATCFVPSDQGATHVLQADRVTMRSDGSIILTHVNRRPAVANDLSRTE